MTTDKHLTGEIYSDDEPDITKSTTTKIDKKWNINIYLVSEKGRELTMGLSLTHAFTLGVTGLSILFSNVLGSQNVSYNTVEEFFIVLSIVCIVGLLTLLILGACNKLTQDNHYRDQRNMTFLRGGMLALGTGGLLYYAVVVGVYATTGHECVSIQVLLEAIFAMILIVTQVAFLLRYSKVNINQSVPLSIGARFVLTQVIGTNLCVWLKTVIEESLHEIDMHENGHHYQMLDFGDASWDNYAADPADNSSCIDNHDTLDYVISPYTFPLLIEFCVVSSTMLLAVWERCGSGHPCHQAEKNKLQSIANSLTDVYPNRLDNSDVSSVTSITANSRASFNGTLDDSHESKYYNTNIGFITGWLTILVSVVMVIGGLYASSNGSIDTETLVKGFYATNLGIVAMCAIVIPVTMYKMSVLTFKDDEIKLIRKGEHQIHGHHIHKDLDKNLMTLTVIALLAFKIMCMIAAYENDSYLIFFDGLLSIVMGYTQTMFINWYAFNKRTTTQEQRARRPGRQGLEFLRCANFALWLVNTFLLKNPIAKHDMEKTFSFMAWVIISNIVQPLTILFYFHSMICYTEVIIHSYTTKYIGIVRPTKQKNLVRVPSDVSLNVVSF